MLSNIMLCSACSAATAGNHDQAAEYNVPSGSCAVFAGVWSELHCPLCFASFGQAVLSRFKFAVTSTVMSCGICILTRMSSICQGLPGFAEVTLSCRTPLCLPTPTRPPLCPHPSLLQLCHCVLQAAQVQKSTMAVPTALASIKQHRPLFNS